MFYGGNRMGMYTIYTKPINKKDCSITTTIKRPFEKTEFFQPRDRQDTIYLSSEYYTIHKRWGTIR